MFVCHKCDNQRCVNPDHLFVKNNSNNPKDAHNKERLGNKLILNKEQIKKIHNMFDNGLTKTEIAKRLGYNKKQVDVAFNPYTVGQEFKSVSH